MKYILSIIFLFFLNSCGYPDIDSVPDFNESLLTNEEIIDYCSNLSTNKKNIQKCINDYKSK
tara:strand:+ start:189 stop:374 length:186 start_codon:yes stop_codon:yes gene_type:complete